MSISIAGLIAALLVGLLALLPLFMLLRALRWQNNSQGHATREKLIPFLKNVVMPIEFIAFALIGYFYIGPILSGMMGIN